MQIEIRPCQPSLGYHRQAWPLTRHHIVRIARREVRLIVGHDESPRLTGMVAIILASFFLP